MFVSRNHSEFNDALNKFAGTNGVGYAAPWDMSTHSGRQYLSTHHDVAGREFARVALDKGVLRGGSLVTEHVLTAPTPSQKAALFAMRDSTSATQFDAALRLAVRTGALSPVAMTIFAPPHAIALQAPTMVPVHLHSVNAAEKGEQLQVEDLADPTDMQVDSQQHARDTSVDVTELLAEDTSVDVTEQLAEDTSAAVTEQLAEAPRAAVTMKLAARTPGMSSNALVAPVKKRRKR